MKLFIFLGLILLTTPSLVFGQVRISTIRAGGGMIYWFSNAGETTVALQKKGGLSGQVLIGLKLTERSQILTGIGYGRSGSSTSNVTNCNEDGEHTGDTTLISN